MNHSVRVAGATIVGAVLMSACATKGFVRNSVRDERVARQVADSGLRTDISTVSSEVAAVRSDLATLRTDVQGLRSDLTSLRTEFGARITAMEEGIKFAFPVTFAFDDASVRDTDRAALDRFAQVAQKYYPGSKITVEGFADPAGTTRYNVALSKRRADAVAQYLVEKGMSTTQLHAVGYGETRQVNPGAQKDAPGAEENRRVVFVIETKGASTAVAMAQPEGE